MNLDAHVVVVAMTLQQNAGQPRVSVQDSSAAIDASCKSAALSIPRDDVQGTLPRENDDGVFLDALAEKS